MPTRLVILSVFLVASGTAHAQEKVDYLKDIRPIFQEFCVKCHGPKKQRGRLRLDTGENIVKKGSESGAILVPGKSETSLILKALRGNDPNVLLKMPPSDQPAPSKKQIALIEEWIKQGAPYPKDEKAADPVGEETDHWAFKRPVRPVPPRVKNEAAVRNPIDRFVLAPLERQGLTLSEQEDRATLIRRLCLDLLGLPPAPREVDDFVRDARPDAYERLVERILASPHYGERWGRHWLDLARYADSNGYSIDAPRTIWPYRDWVINAFNRDLPFSEFVTQQLAGDLLPPAVEHKVATGFHRNTQINQEGGIDLEQFRVESVVDRVNTTGSVFLGLTLGCAQCHDHKYDPISQREYYEVYAFFNSCDEPTLPLPTPEETVAIANVKLKQSELQKALKDLDTASPARQKTWEDSLSYPVKATFPKDVREFLEKPDYQRTAKEKQIVTNFYRNVEQLPLIFSGLAQVGRLDGFAGLEGGHHLHLVTYRTMLEKKVDELKKSEPKPVTTMVLQERTAPRETYIQIRGDFLRKGKKVAPAVPAVFPSLKSASGSSGASRLDFSRWLVSEENPLTARVFVNRLWQQYFGRGIVETENDFGTQGRLPSHPELLDWLAVEFMSPSPTSDGGAEGTAWSMKRMHRLIVTSAAYRQSSKTTPEYAKKDPQNRLLGRQNRLRLEAEIVRDVALASSGLLNPKVGGPSVFPPQPEGVFAFTQVRRDWKADTGPDRFRRGMYTYFWRSAPHPALMAFDAPDGVNSCTRRIRSNTPLQALTLLNDKGFFEYAQGLATRVLKEADGDDAEKINHAFRLCVARTPTPREHARLLTLVTELKQHFNEDLKEARIVSPPDAPSIPEGAAWTTLSRVLLNLDEFITRE